MIIAHRGASAYRPEHTFAAWDLAVEMGADLLEVDVRATRDSVLVVLHDETLDRTARPAEDGAACTGPVADRTVEELAGCEVTSWFPGRVPAQGPPETIPTLDSVLARYAAAGRRLYIEIKGASGAPGTEEALVALLRERGLVTEHGAGGKEARDAGGDAPVVLQSFDEASLRRLRELAPALPRVLLVRGRESQASLWRRLPLAAEYADGIGPAAEDVTRQLVRAAHARCLEVHPWTVNDAREMERLLALGVDGIFTDRPDVLAGVVERTGAGSWRALRPRPVSCPDAGAEPRDASP